MVQTLSTRRSFGVQTSEYKGFVMITMGAYTSASLYLCLEGKVHFCTK